MDDNLEILADRYARALYDISKHQHLADRVMQELKALHELWLCESDFRMFLTHPSVIRQEKEDVVDDIAKKKHFCSTVVNFLKLLIDNSRIILLHSVFLRYRDIYELQQNLIRVIIEGPRPLSHIEANNLGKTLKAKFKKDILLEDNVKVDLISGLHIRYRDRIFDNSIISKLDKLRGVLV